MSDTFIPFKNNNNAVIQKSEWFKITDTLNCLKSWILDNSKGDTIKTEEVKIALTKLGHVLNKRVYTNKLSEDQINDINDHLKQIGKFDATKNGFKNTEWLYDVHWYTDVVGEYYIPSTLDLVAESEWQKVRDTDKKRGDRNPKEMELSAIKYDFQKLLTSNAKLKLMICRLSYQKELDKLENYVKKAIHANQQLAINSNFLIISYLKKKDAMYYLYISKRSNNKLNS